ncbi:hypothetical protein DV737_g309, partial [Chaetothyriales sp. CBS 132003]
MVDVQLRQRLKATLDEAAFIIQDRPPGKEGEPHPAGEAKYGAGAEIVRLLLLTTYFFGSCLAINATQMVGAPLYFFSKDYYYAYMALSKQSFGILVTTVTQWFSPTVIRVSWDADVRGQLYKGPGGRLESSLPERLVLMANHQIYSDWLYLWWVAYTSKMHGHIYIILKESLKYMPIISPGILFYGFIFMARKWGSDKSRMEYRLQKLKTRHSGPLAGSQPLDPMWLLIFPEGTNLSRNTRKDSVRWSQKSGIPDLRHELLPRSTGMQFCLEQLGDSVEWVYDCTMAYEGVPAGEYAPEYFTLRSIYFQGRPPKSVNLYWRRFKTSEIPYQDQAAFDKWILDRWREKDDMLEQYYTTGRFPSDGVTDAKTGARDGFIETEVQPRSLLEVGQIFVVLASLALVANVVAKLWAMFALGAKPVRKLQLRRPKNAIAQKLLRVTDDVDLIPAAIQRVKNKRSLTLDQHVFRQALRLSIQLVVAKENNLDLELVETRPALGLSAEYLKLNPLGKIPTFVGSNGFVLSEAIAIAIYLASQNERTALLGKTKQDYASIVRWLSYANSEVLPTLSGWFGPLIGQRPYNQKQVQEAKAASNKVLQVIEDHLHTQTFFVGERITLADLFVASELSRSFQHVLDKAWRAEHPHISRWYETIVNQPIWRAVIKEPILADEAAKHPLEALPKPTLILDDWKRKYSNEETRTVALPWFWEQYKEEEYSLWRVDYLYNDELTLTFMSSNLIGGFFARLEASRKFLFGAASVYGKSNDSIISGAFLVRGAEALPAFDVAPDYESYKFTKLDAQKAGDREFVEDQWSWDKPIVVDGKEYEWADGKVFK